jgi:predicted metal-dependent peptidase
VTAAAYSTDQIIEIERTRLLGAHPFFGILITYLRPEGHDAAWFTERGLCPTMATDGVRLLYCHDFVRRLVADPSASGAVGGVLAHEVLHCALGHLWRRGGREPLLWNIASDMVINHLLARNRIPLPADCVMPPRGWETLSEEEIYERLLQNAQAAAQAAASSALGATDVLQPSAAGGGGHGSDDGRGAQGDGSADRSGADAWRDRLIRAAQAAKSQGRCPAGVSELVDELLAPTQDWRTLLALFVQPHAHDYDWMRPDRRLLGAYDLYVPTLQGEKVEDVVAAIDTSGSISSDELRVFLSELRGILQAYPWMRVHLATCDAQVWDWRELTSDDPVPREVRGRGGTDFRPVFEEIDRRGMLPSAVVFMTDGMGDYPDAAPPYPVLWVLTPHHQEPPFGATAVLDDAAITPP